MPAEMILCARCRQPLPEGSGFCVACGHTNELALLERRTQVMERADQRMSWARRLGDLLGGLGRIFRGR